MARASALRQALANLVPAKHLLETTIKGVQPVSGGAGYQSEIGFQVADQGGQVTKLVFQVQTDAYGRWYLPDVAIVQRQVIAFMNKGAAVAAAHGNPHTMTSLPVPPGVDKKQFQHVQPVTANPTIARQPTGTFFVNWQAAAPHSQTMHVATPVPGQKPAFSPDQFGFAQQGGAPQPPTASAPPPAPTPAQQNTPPPTTTIQVTPPAPPTASAPPSTPVPAPPAASAPPSMPVSAPPAASAPPSAPPESAPPLSVESVPLPGAPMPTEGPKPVFNPAQMASQPALKGTAAPTNGPKPEFDPTKLSPAPPPGSQVPPPQSQAPAPAAPSAPPAPAAPKVPPPVMPVKQDVPIKF